MGKRSNDEGTIFKRDNSYCSDFAAAMTRVVYEQGFQVCFFKHIDTKTPHLHYVVNSVNGLTGKKIANVTSLAGLVYKFLRERYENLRWNGIRFNDGRNKHSLEL